MNIRNKLFSGFGIVILLLIVITAISFTQFSTVDSTYSKLINEQVKKGMLTERFKIYCS